MKTVIRSAETVAAKRFESPISDDTGSFAILARLYAGKSYNLASYFKWYIQYAQEPRNDKDRDQLAADE